MFKYLKGNQLEKKYDEFFNEIHNNKNKFNNSLIYN